MPLVLLDAINGTIPLLRCTPYENVQVLNCYPYENVVFDEPRKRLCARRGKGRNGIKVPRRPSETTMYEDTQE